MKKIILIFLTAFISLLNVFFQVKIVKAESIYNLSVYNPVYNPSGYNLFGWAWSENIGWISFSNASGGGNIDYGVNVNSAGLISGYVWSEHIGWISFNNNQCPSSPCQAKLDQSTGKVSGWARALNHGDGWDGWIHLRNDSDNDGKINENDNNGDYGVFVVGCNWNGWAWGGDVVGWIHFRLLSGSGGSSLYGVSGTGKACANQLPSAQNLSVSFLDPCVSSQPAAIFSWTFQGQGTSQSAYQVQVASEANFFQIVNDSNIINSSSNSYSIQRGLSYNTTYYWRLKVWDSNGNVSDWIYGGSFKTPPHYPSVDFSWSPQNPSMTEFVQFTNQSSVEGTRQNWFWSFQDGNPTSSTEENPRVKFNSAGSKQITLRVTDSYGNSCEKSKTLNIGLPLPEWEEIPPILWLRNLFAAFSALAIKR